MLNKKNITAIVVASLLTACAAPARIDQMIAKPGTSVIASNSQLKNQIAVKEVTGGSSTNPLWTSQIESADFERALEKSLESAGLIAPRQSGRYYVIADMTKVDQPFGGFDMTVTAYIRYIVVERSTGKTVFDKVLSVPFTATVSDAFMGVERLKIANEGAARVNIEKFINDLTSMDITSVSIK